MMKRFVIVAGGDLGDWVHAKLRPDDALIGADRGALWLVQNGYRPLAALGDFDSVTAEEREEVRRLSEEWVECDAVMKDCTDTEMALDWALAREPEEVLLLGVLGTRFDHGLANVHLLRRASDRGVSAWIADAHNEIRLMGPQANRLTLLNENDNGYVSLLPLDETVTGITLTGFQYPLANAMLRIGQTLGISNRIAEAEGTIVLRSGHLLVVRSRDG